MSSNVVPFPTQRDSRNQFTGYNLPELRSLSTGLMLILHISPDRSLVSLLGFSRASSNHEAIIYWIMRQWSPFEIERLHKPLDTISQALLHYLNDQIHTYLGDHHDT